MTSQLDVYAYRVRPSSVNNAAWRTAGGLLRHAAENIGRLLVQIVEHVQRHADRVAQNLGVGRLRHDSLLRVLGRQPAPERGHQRFKVLTQGCLVPRMHVHLTCARLTPVMPPPVDAKGNVVSFG